MDTQNFAERRPPARRFRQIPPLARESEWKTPRPLCLDRNVCHMVGILRRAKGPSRPDSRLKSKMETGNALFWPTAQASAVSGADVNRRLPTEPLRFPRLSVRRPDERGWPLFRKNENRIDEQGPNAIVGIDFPTDIKLNGDVIHIAEKVIRVEIISKIA